MSGTTAGVTSGTVLGNPFNQRKVLDHAFRRAGYSPQKVPGEWLELAQDLLFLQLSEYVNFGYPLWTRQELLLPCTVGSPNVPCPYGTVDVNKVYWRTMPTWSGATTLSTGEPAPTVTDLEPGPDVGIKPPNPGVIANFGGPTRVDSIGVLPGFSTGMLLDGNGNPILDGTYNPILALPNNYTACLEVVTSRDGFTWINEATLPSTTFRAGQWAWFDLAPSITAPYIQVVMPGTNAWIVNEVAFSLANSTQIEIGKQNIDEYYDLPDKFYHGTQPNQAFVDRQRDQPIVKIWPTLNQQGFYRGTIVALARRYIQDPGQLTNSLEIPARWFEGVVSRLGIRLMDELPDPGAGTQESYFGLMGKQQRRQNLEQAAAKGEAGMWSEERDRSGINIAPNISFYTR